MTRTFIQTSVFEKQWDALGLKDEDLCRLEYEIMNEPQLGVIIPGTGKLRKRRFAIGNKGKSGGTRVCYVDFVVLDTIYLFSIYPKSQKENLSKEECNTIKKLIDKLESELKKGDHL